MSNDQCVASRNISKRLLGAVLRSTWPVHDDGGTWPFIVRFHGSTKSTRELTVWPMATGRKRRIAELPLRACA